MNNTTTAPWQAENVTNVTLHMTLDGAYHFTDELTLMSTYLAFLILICFSGSFGNIMVIGAVLTDKRLWKEGNVFLVNLAAADMCVTGFVDPFSIAGVFVGPEWFLEHSGLCHTIAAVCLVSCVCSLWSIGAISLNRYFLLCKPHIYKVVFTWRNTLMITACLWFGAFLLDLPNMLGWGDHTYDMKTMACSYDRVASYSFTLFFVTMFVTIPLCTVVFSNINIYVTVVKSRMRVTSHNPTGSAATGSGSVLTVSEQISATDSGNYGSQTQDGPENSTQLFTLKPLAGKQHLLSPGTTATARSSKKTKQQSKKGKERSQEIKLAKTLFLVFIVFCLCWTPYGLLVLVDIDNKAHKGWYLLAILLAHTSSTLNFIIYGITNQAFRLGYKCFLRRIFGRPR